MAPNRVQANTSLTPLPLHSRSGSGSRPVPKQWSHTDEIFTGASQGLKSSLPVPWHLRHTECPVPLQTPHCSSFSIYPPFQNYSRYRKGWSSGILSLPSCVDAKAEISFEASTLQVGHLVFVSGASMGREISNIFLHMGHRYS